MEELLEQIECLRQNLHEIALLKGISHPDVLIASQTLDEIIVKFYRAKISLRKKAS